MKTCSVLPLAVCASLIAAGCTGGKGGGSLATPKLSHMRANLNLAGVDVPVDGTIVDEKGVTVYEWRAYSEVIEREGYAFEGPNVSLVDALGETYAPPLPLIGSKATSWKGKVTTAGIEREAKASMKEGKGTVEFDGNALDASMVSVTLEIGSTPFVSKRELSFYFVPGQGLLKRSFGTYSVRTPLPDESY